MQTEHSVRDGTSNGHQRIELAAARAEIDALRAALSDAHRESAHANLALQDAARQRDAHAAALDAGLAERAAAAAELQRELAYRDALAAEGEARMAESARALALLQADEGRLRVELEMKVSAHAKLEAELHEALGRAGLTEIQNGDAGQSGHGRNSDPRTLSARFAEERERLEFTLKQKAGRIELVERRLAEEREAGIHLREQFEKRLIDCGQKVAELQTIVQRRDLRIAMLQGELAVYARRSEPASGIAVLPFDAEDAPLDGATSTVAAADALCEPTAEASQEDAVEIRRVQRPPASEAPVEAAASSFSLEPDLEILEAWESLLGSRPRRRALRR